MQIENNAGEKPASWGDLSAPPVWGHGAKGDTIYKPESSAIATTVAPQTAGATVGPYIPESVAAPVVAPDTSTSAVMPSFEPISEPETVFDANRFVAKAPDTSVARKAVTGTIRRAALWFFVAAAAGAGTWFFFREQSTEIATGGAIDFVLFLLIGIFAYRMSRVAFLAAIVVYGFGTAMLLLFALMSDLPLVLYIKPLLVRCGILYKHYRNYGLLTDLHELENG